MSPEIGRDLWPRFGRVFPIELALSFLIMAAAWTAFSAAIAPAMFKARLTEAWITGANERYRVVETLALDGTEVRAETHTVILKGAVRGLAYEIHQWPVVGSEGAVVIWHCGRSTLPERLLYSLCRAKKGA